MRVLVIIPAYNEARNLPAVVADIRQHLQDVDILVVDDGSTDDTPAVLKQLGVRWMRLSQQLGPGSAMRAGLRYAARVGFDTVVRADGDGQHPAEELGRVLAPIRAGTADAVVGSRYADGRPVATPKHRRLLKYLLARILTMLTRQRLTDPTSGLWAFGPRALGLLVEHHPLGYPEPELVLFLVRNGLRLVEVPVSMRDRLSGRSSLTPPRTGAAFARLLLLLLVVPLRQSVGHRHD